MLTAALLLLANTLLFSLRLSGGSFPKPLTAAEEREYLARFARGDQGPATSSLSGICVWLPTL